jgi:hypothetical protein
MSISYPYFSIAKEFNIDYSIVLKFVERVEKQVSSHYDGLTVWQASVIDAFINERERRKSII